MQIHHEEIRCLSVTARKMLRQHVCTIYPSNGVNHWLTNLYLKIDCKIGMHQWYYKISIIQTMKMSYIVTVLKYTPDVCFNNSSGKSKRNGNVLSKGKLR